MTVTSFLGHASEQHLQSGGEERLELARASHQIESPFLDAGLGFTLGAAAFIAERLGRLIQVGDHEAWTDPTNLRTANCPALRCGPE